MSFFIATILVSATIVKQAYSMKTDQPAGFSRSPIHTLIVNADVTVVLVHNDQMSVETIGSDKFLEQLRIEQRSDTLLINATRKKDMKDGGVIFIPANKLAHIRINSAAHVKSFNTLQLTNLEVVINGDCSVAVSNTGNTSLIGTPQYAVEQTQQTRQWAIGAFLSQYNN